MTTPLKGRKKFFYLMIHSTHYIFLWLYNVKHMVKDHSDYERENLLLPLHGLLFLISSKGAFISTIPTDRTSTYHSLCYTSCKVLAGTRNSSKGPLRRIDPMTHHTISRNSTTELPLPHSLKVRSFTLISNDQNSIFFLPGSILILHKVLLTLLKDLLLKSHLLVLNGLGVGPKLMGKICKNKTINNKAI